MKPPSPSTPDSIVCAVAHRIASHLIRGAARPDRAWVHAVRLSATTPFGLSLSKPICPVNTLQPFDKLRANGLSEQYSAQVLSCNSLFTRHGLLAAAQPLDQPIELVHRTKMNRQLAHVLAAPVAFNLLFDAHFDLGHQQVGQLFFDAAGVA